MKKKTQASKIFFFLKIEFCFFLFIFNFLLYFLLYIYFIHSFITCDCADTGELKHCYVYNNISIELIQTQPPVFLDFYRFSNCDGPMDTKAMGQKTLLRT